MILFIQIVFLSFLNSHSEKLAQVYINPTNLQRGSGGSWTEESPATNDYLIFATLLLNPWMHEMKIKRSSDRNEL